MRRREQPLDLLPERIGRWIGDESIDFFNRRREADQIEANSAQPSDAIGFGREAQTFALQSIDDVVVDWHSQKRYYGHRLSAISFRPDLRDRRTNRSFERPVIRAF